MVKNKKGLSALEWEIMDTIWNINKQAVSVREVLSVVYPKGEKAYTTVQTVMNNLVKKGFLEKEKIGLVNFYQPLKKQEEILSKEVQQFLNKTFSGSLNTLVSFMMDMDALTLKDIQELKRLVEEKEREGGTQ